MVPSGCHRKPATKAVARYPNLRIPATCNASPHGVCDPETVKLRCLIVDDSSSFLEAAQALLEREGLSVVGVASSGGEALARAEELRPDVVLVDISLRGESGFEVTRRLVEDSDDGGSSVILISTHSESDFADLIEASPAIGFLPKSELSAQAIRQLVNGRSR